MDKLNYIYNHTLKRELGIKDDDYFRQHSMRNRFKNHFVRTADKRPEGWNPNTDTFKQDKQNYKQSLIRVRAMINGNTMTYGTPINQAVNTDDGNKGNQHQVGANNADKTKMAKIQRENEQLKMKLKAKKFRQGMQRN